MPVDAEAGFLPDLGSLSLGPTEMSGQAIRLQFIKGRFGAVNFKETTFLSRVASVLGQADLNTISSQDRGLTGLIGSRDNPKTHDCFVKGKGRVYVSHGQGHRIFEIWISRLEHRFHWFSISISIRTFLLSRGSINEPAAA